MLFLVGLPGFEPGKSGPESEVLPLHHSPLFGAKIKRILIPSYLFDKNHIHKEERFHKIEEFFIRTFIHTINEAIFVE